MRVENAKDLSGDRVLCRKPSKKLLLTQILFGELPIHKIENADEKALHASIVRSVEQIMDTKKKLAEAANERDRDFWTNKCNVLEDAIDQAVYRLYDLTPDEIKLIENS